MADPRCDNEEFWSVGTIERRRLWFMGSSLLWLIVPFTQLGHEDPSSGQIVLAIVGTIVFSAAYLEAARRPVDQVEVPKNIARLVVMVAIAVTLTLTATSTFALLFVITAVAAGLRLPARLGVIAVIVCSFLAVGLSEAAGAGADASVSWASPPPPSGSCSWPSGG